MKYVAYTPVDLDLADSRECGQKVAQSEFLSLCVLLRYTPTSYSYPTSLVAAVLFGG